MTTQTEKLLLFTETTCQELSVTEAEQQNHPTATLITATEQHCSTISITPIRIGHQPNDHINLQNTPTTLTINPTTINITNATNLYLNGKKLTTTGHHPINPGDSIWAGTTNIIIHNNYITCFGANYTSKLNISTFTPQRYEEYPIYKRSPRLIKREPTETIELTAPAKKEEPKKGGLIKIILPPLAMVAVTVSMGILMGRGMFVLMSAAAMTMSLIFAVTNFFGDRKTRKQKEKKRIENYENYLVTERKKLHTLHNDFEQSLKYHNLSPRDIEREIMSYSSRLYERAANDGDFLTLSLGYSTLPTSYTVKFSTNTQDTDNDTLIEEMQALGNTYQTARNMPTVIDLKQAHLGLVGEKAYIHRQLTSALIQLCFFQSYHDIEIILLVEEEDVASFEWVRWYPHCRNKNINITGLIAAENQRDQVLGNIAQVLKTRKRKQDEEKKDSKYLPHYIFIIDNPKLIINHSIMEYLQTPSTSLGFSLIYTTQQRANLPDNILTVFMLDGGDKGTLLMNRGELLNRSVTLPDITDINTEIIARKLAPLKHTQGVSTQIPESVTFFELYNVKRPDEIPVLDLWEKNACHKSLAVPLGLRGKEDIVALNLHEKAHGPHGLVAGTTGSGKSEIVQSYILSLAVNFHPHEVGFLLIDYKGGGMANLFENLPHLLGTITNLDGSESMRALASIKSELARRQRIFGECGVNSINQYTKLFRAREVTLPMPHLFIISDEFAELKKEQPEFMAELVSTARIGRSLGVHLILATQKPTGVVDDQIWSNSKFKLALKVADESDSNEILKTPDAARITQPGRAYLQVGNNEIYEMFQSAYSGASFSESVVKHGFDGRVYLINQLGQGELLNDDLSAIDAEQESKLTQLDVTVNHINDLHKQLDTTIVERPWLPPLEQKLISPHINIGTDVGLITTHDLNAAIGMADIPEAQTQTEYTHNFMDDGNLAFFGASGFGKSTSAMNVALQLASQNSPLLLNYFVLDYGNSALAQLRGLPHTADYLTIDDAEKLDKLTKLLEEELKKRKSLFAAENAINFRMYNSVAAAKIPAILIIIDNYDVIKEISMELEEFLVKLTRDGVGVGIYTVVTASRSNALRYSVLNNFKNKIAHYMFDATDVIAVVGRSTYQLPEIQGRALVKIKDIHIAQCYLPAPYENDIDYANNISAIVSGIAESSTASKAAGIRVVPDVVEYADLVPFLIEKQAVIGFDPATTEPVHLDTSNRCQLIVGASGTGKTNVLKIIATQFSGSTMFIVDSNVGDLNMYDGLGNVTYMEKESQLDDFYDALNSEVESRIKLQKALEQRLREFVASQPQVVVLIDDFDNFLELSKNRKNEVEVLVPKAMEMGVCFIATTLPTQMKDFGVFTKLFKDTQYGVVLGNPGGQSIVQQITTPRDYKAMPDMGFWHKRDQRGQVKMPQIREENQ